MRRLRRPYMWVKYHPEFGVLFTTQNLEGYRILFNRKSKAFCGWDNDRNRFICEPLNRFTPIIPGTWKYNLYNGKT